MYTNDEWNYIVDEFESRKAKIICTDGSEYVGVGGPYCQWEDDDGNSEWAITLDMQSEIGMIFRQSAVERIEYLD